MSDPESERTVIVHETPRPPRTGLWLALLAVAPFPLAVPALWILPEVAVREAVRLWGAALLLFFAGVRRGLSFRTEGGATRAQLAVFAWLFAAGLAALLLPLQGALWLLTAGFVSLGALDPWAARRGEAPLWFAGLRAAQMPVAVVGLVGVVVS